ncbi:hypothetical protein FGG78_19460 [Thioclava sp. BHET1]|nr:hypothetical protein FGG78_19460 [Thioclava sp. BHET1]
MIQWINRSANGISPAACFSSKKKYAGRRRRRSAAERGSCRWRWLMLEGGSVAVAEDDEVTSNKVVRQKGRATRDLVTHEGRCHWLYPRALSGFCS